MRDVNKVLLMGRLGSDPVSRETPSGVALTRFSVATSMRKKSDGRDGAGDAASGEAEGEERESTVWHRVVAWGREGEVCARYLKKGAPVFVEGRIRQNRYTTKDGQQRTDFEVHAERVNFLPAGGGAAWASRERESVGGAAALMN